MAITAGNHASFPWVPLRVPGFPPAPWLQAMDNRRWGRATRSRASPRSADPRRLSLCTLVWQVGNHKTNLQIQWLNHHYMIHYIYIYNDILSNINNYI